MRTTGHAGKEFASFVLRADVEQGRFELANTCATSPNLQTAIPYRPQRRWFATYAFAVIPAKLSFMTVAIQSENNLYKP
jgi:hypothetical protein